MEKHITFMCQLRKNVMTTKQLRINQGLLIAIDL